MPMQVNNKPIKKPFKPCKEFGCRELTRESYCKNHRENAQETNRYYNKYARDQAIDSFYKSRAWQRVRSLAYERDNGLCQRCKSNGQLVRGDVVHHIIEVKDDWSLRLVLSNLETLCHSCHNREHKSPPRHDKIYK